MRREHRGLVRIRRSPTGQGRLKAFTGINGTLFSCRGFMCERTAARRDTDAVAQQMRSRHPCSLEIWQLAG